MPKLKAGHVSPTAAEDAAINAGIAADADNPAWSREDFARAKVGAAMPAAGKVSVTIRIDADVLEAFKARSAARGKGYQTLMNEALRAAVLEGATPVTADVLRRILREELHHA